MAVGHLFAWFGLIGFFGFPIGNPKNPKKPITGVEWVWAIDNSVKVTGPVMA